MDMMEIFAWCLRAAGWQVDRASNGLEAVLLATATDPAVIVLDLNLPVLDGVGAARLLKNDPRTARVPLIACTAFGQERASEAAGWFAEFVAKPCTAEHLVDVVEEVATRSSP
jgi:CheY-like chemotaxis protein